MVIGTILPRVTPEWERRVEVASEMHAAAQACGWCPASACSECGGDGWVPEYENGEAYQARCDTCGGMGACGHE